MILYLEKPIYRYFLQVSKQRDLFVNDYNLSLSFSCLLPEKNKCIAKIRASEPSEDFFFFFFFFFLLLLLLFLLRVRYFKVE